MNIYGSAYEATKRQANERVAGKLLTKIPRQHHKNGFINTGNDGKQNRGTKSAPSRFRPFDVSD